MLTNSYMNYSNGTKIEVGDKVRLGDDSRGIVVCSIDDDEYTVGQPKEKWSFLERGFVVEFPKFGLVHYEEPEMGLEFLARADDD